MYFKTLASRKIYSLYTWSYIFGRCSTKSVTAKNCAIKHKKRPPTNDWSELHEGILPWWHRGPPFVFQVKRIINLRDKSTYYRNKVRKRTHWAYYWRWVVSPLAATTVEAIAMALRAHHPTSDVRMCPEGTPVLLSLNSDVP